MGEGDTMDIGLPPCQEAFLEEVSKLGKPLVGLHFSGRPISSDIADEKLDAILECWCPSEAGAEAVADVLLGKVNPSGKLPVCVAVNAGQIPVYYNQLWGSRHYTGQKYRFHKLCGWFSCAQILFWPWSALYSVLRIQIW